MIEFFVILVVLMVLAVALGSWIGELRGLPPRRVVVDRRPMIRRNRQSTVESRRMVSRRRSY